MLCLEAPPGSGKHNLANALHEDSPRLRISPCVAAAGDLESYQMEPERWAFYLQLRILADRCSAIRQNSFDIMCGSPTSDRHCHAALTPMTTTEKALYDAWADHLTENLVSVNHLLIKSPDMFRQIVARGQKGQAGLTSHHLALLQTKYASVFSQTDSVRLSGAILENDLLMRPSINQVKQVLQTRS